MKDKIKDICKEKENLLTFLIILLVSVILCFNFIRFHTVPDTYNVLVKKDYNSKTFFIDGRLVTGVYLYIGNLLNIPVTVLTVISAMFGIIFLSLSVHILYKVISDKKDDTIIKIIKLLGSYLFVFNPLSIEHFAYVESGIIVLGKFLCILAAKKLIMDRKVPISFLLVIIAGICYQGILNVFITLSVLLFVLKKNEEKTKKFNVKEWRATTMGNINLISYTSSSYYNSKRCK